MASGRSIAATAKALDALCGLAGGTRIAPQAEAARRYGLRAMAAGERGDWRAYSCWAALCDAAMADAEGAARPATA